MELQLHNVQFPLIKGNTINLGNYTLILDLEVNNKNFGIHFSHNDHIHEEDCTLEMKTVIEKTIKFTKNTHHFTLYKGRDVFCRFQIYGLHPKGLETEEREFCIEGDEKYVLKI